MKRVWLAKLTLALSAPLMVLCGSELMLRLVWSNPYRPAPPVDQYRSRLAMPWSRASANVAGLYEGGGWVYGETTPLRSLSSGRSTLPTPVLAIGGSTTQAMLVPEGERWPDLLEPPAMNFGTESNCVIDSYRNLRMLFEEIGLRPERVLVMHGVNDLTEILRGPDNFDLEKLSHRMLLIPLEEEAKQRVLGIAVRDSSLLSWLNFNLYEWIGRDITEAAPISEVPDDAPSLSNAQFEALAAYLMTVLPARAEVFHAIARLAAQHGADLVLMTQPHAMRPDYQPYRVERRMRRSLGAQFMTHEQHALLLDLINQHTRDVAARLEAPLIDLALCFDELDPTPLFYDGVHYTPQGSRAASKCVNEDMPPLRFNSLR
jgi:hypothetical protein